MPIYTVDVEKLYQGEYWTNRYLVEADTLDLAIPMGNNIADAEMGFHYDAVVFTKVRVSDMIEETDVYKVTQLNAPGDVSSTGADFLPLFNVTRVDLNPAGHGRPSRKYYRTPLEESAVLNGRLHANHIARVNTGLAIILGASVNLVDPQGQVIVSSEVWPFVGMRQLRRGSKRKAPAPSTPE